MEKVLVIEANNDCYELNQLGDTMTVRELISLLENYDPDMKVCIANDNGYTYGEITSSEFYRKRVEKNED